MTEDRSTTRREPTPGNQIPPIEPSSGDGDDDDPNLLYPFIAQLQPEDWEDGSIYGLPESR